MALVAQSLGALFGLLFLVASLTKADGWRAWRELVDRLALPRSLASSVLIGVPVAEFVTAVLCVARPHLGTAIAAMVLAFFALGVLVFSKRLSGSECACFGAISRSRISPRLAVRNALLAAIATVVALAPTSAGSSGLPMPLVVALMLVGLNGALIAGIRRTRHDLSFFSS